MKKSRLIRIPLESYENEKRRMEQINKKLNDLTKKQYKIKFSDYFRLRSKKPIYVYDDELIKHFIKKKDRKILLI